MLTRSIVFAAIILLFIIIAGCTGTNDTIPYKKPPNLTPDSNVMAAIHREWANQTSGHNNVSINDSGAIVYYFQSNGDVSYEIIKFETSDGNSHYCTIFFKYTNESPNMLEINGRPAFFYNITLK